MIREAIKSRLKELGISQIKCANDNDIGYQNFNKFLSYRRSFPLGSIEKVLRYLELEIVGKPRKKINMIRNYTPIMWDDRVFSFVPMEASSATPQYSEEECAQICGELNQIIKLCSYLPKAGDVYYHPVTFDRGKFVVMDNQAAFDECPYPACADQESCQKVCDMMNRVLDGK